MAGRLKKRLKERPLCVEEKERKNERLIGGVLAGKESTRNKTNGGHVLGGCRLEKRRRKRELGRGCSFQERAGGCNLGLKRFFRVFWCLGFGCVYFFWSLFICEGALYL